MRDALCDALDDLTFAACFAQMHTLGQQGEASEEEFGILEPCSGLIFRHQHEGSMICLGLRDLLLGRAAGAHVE